MKLFGGAIRNSSCAFRRPFEDGTYLFTVARGNLDVERGEFYVTKAECRIGFGSGGARPPGARSRGSGRAARSCWSSGARARPVLRVRRARLALPGAAGPAGPVGRRRRGCYGSGGTAGSSRCARRCWCTGRARTARRAGSGWARGSSGWAGGTTGGAATTTALAERRTDDRASRRGTVPGGQGAGRRRISSPSRRPTARFG